MQQCYVILDDAAYEAWRARTGRSWIDPDAAGRCSNWHDLGGFFCPSCRRMSQSYAGHDTVAQMREKRDERDAAIRAWLWETPPMKATARAAAIRFDCSKSTAATTLKRLRAEPDYVAHVQAERDSALAALSATMRASSEEARA